LNFEIIHFVVVELECTWISKDNATIRKSYSHSRFTKIQSNSMSFFGYVWELILKKWIYR